jgi:hypothetical protein
MADDQDDSSPPQPSALDSLQAPPVSPAGRAWGENYLKEHPEGVDTRGEASIFQDFEANAEQARQQLRAAREHLAAQRMDPGVLGMRVAQAMMAPSRYAGGISNQLSNAMGAVADWRQQNQQFQQGQQTQDDSLAQQLTGVDASSLKARLQLQELKERNQTSMLDAAMKATAQPPKPETPPANIHWLDTGSELVPTDPHTGQRVPGLAPVAKTAKPPTAPGQIDDQTMDYLYQYWGNTHALPPGYSRNPAMVNDIMSHIAQRSAAEGKTDAAIMANSQLLKSQQKAENDFTPGGKTGQALTSTNRVVAHLSDFNDLFTALNNKDPQAINYAKNKIATWFGSADPTNIQAVAPILGDELTKSIVPGGGGVTERQEFAKNFSTTSSPQQAQGAVQNYLKFLKDQVDGTKFSYEQLPSHPADFETRFLTPRTRDVLGYAHPPGALTLEQRAALIQMIRQKQTQPAGAP